MSESLQDELALLRAALGAHLELLSNTGVSGLPPCDEATLERRRERHRELRREEEAGSSPEPVASVSRNDAEFEANGVVDAAPLLAPEASPPELARLQSPRTDDAAARSSPIRAPVAAELRGSGTDSRLSLEVLAETVRGCVRCDLHRTRTQTVFARGTSQSGICFVGEGPGADEDAQGLPFVGAAGQLLDKMIGAMGYDRDEVYVCNIVKCRPPKNRKPERSEMDACSEYLRQQIELVAPRVIVALGATAVEGLLGLSGIMRLRGRWRLYRGEIPVMPTFHPAYLLRTPEAKREVWADLKLVLEHLGRPVPTR